MVYVIECLNSVAASSHMQSFVRLQLQDFFANFAADIVELQKKDLRSVVMSSQASKHAEWMQAKNFFIRHFDFLALEEKDLLQDWHWSQLLLVLSLSC